MRTPDPAFDFKADPDPTSQNDVDPDSGSATLQQPTLIIPRTDDRAFSTGNHISLNHPNGKKPTKQSQAITVSRHTKQKN
jgi:hypothetical protein